MVRYQENDSVVEETEDVESIEETFGVDSTI